MKVKNILFPTDFSDRSAAALDYASKLAASFGARLHIIYVDDLCDLVGKSAYPYPSFISCADRSEVKAQLESVAPTISGVACSRHFVEGVPATRICALARKEHVDLIVMASHGRTGLSRLVMGSVAENVLRHAPCPVLIFKQSPAERAVTTLDAAACSRS